MGIYSNTKVTKVEARKLLKQLRENPNAGGGTWPRWYLLRLLHTVLGDAKRVRRMPLKLRKTPKYYPRLAHLNGRR